MSKRPQSQLRQAFPPTMRFPNRLQEADLRNFLKPTFRRPTWPACWSICLLLGVPAGRLSAAEPAAPLFEKHVRPIFRVHCVTCHGAGKEKKGNLDVRLVRYLQKGGDSGPSITAGNAAKSNLIERVKSGEMPPGDKKLSPKEIAVLEAWINAGAKTARPEPKSIGPGLRITEEERNHWSFVKPQSTPAPSVRRGDWPKSKIDRYILARLEAKNLTPSPDAKRSTFIRRVSFDLIGLPPTAKEIARFERNRSPNAYAELVDSLLRSPHFGERWGRHWLDVARYSDTKGYVFREDRNYPDAWKYRDWVVRSFNEDRPFHQFIVQQLAADRLPKEKRVYDAMGFLTLGRRFLNNRHDIIDDRIDVTTRGLMGLTVTCARCHDHKYDPIGAQDYYAMYGIFASSNEPKNAPSALRLVDSPRPHDTRIFLRGNPRNPGPVAPRQFLRVLSPENQQPFRDGSGRLQLARAIADESNPLTARVFVNRVWIHLFGKGLVRTPSDFGTRSDPPTHPRLLDDLAVRFMKNNWSVKSLIREIVLSRTYRQQSLDRPAARAVDPENDLLWRMNRKRLGFETSRDYLLAATGTLDRTIGGPPVKLTDSPAPRRRSIYLHVDRQNLPSEFRTFDFASPDTHCPKRYQTSVPQQALFLLNGDFVMQQAMQVVARPEVKNSAGTGERVRQLYLAIYGRPPAADELRAATAFVMKGAPRTRTVAGNGTPWKYGYGAIDRRRKRLAAFHPLKQWTGRQWQGGAALPDPKIGWVLLNANGGHPGNDLKHAAVRRWIAPRDGRISIRGRLQHPRKEGDGVRGVIISSRHGIVGEWTAHNKHVDTRVRSLEVKKGDTVDFVTECITNPTHDGFVWKVTLGPARRRTGGGRGQKFDSATQFRGPAPRPLNRWERLAHVDHSESLAMNDFHIPTLSRRDMLSRSGMGLGALALGSMFDTGVQAAPANPLLAKQPHFPAKAKRVIHLFMNGGPSHLDTFDPKPILKKYAGKPIPIHLRTERKTGAAFPSPYSFKKYGESGIEVSEIFKHTAKHIDDIAVIRSMHADVPNHEPSLLLMNCGDARLVRPSLGSWMVYGLGTDNQNLPAFISMCPNGYPIQESQNWQSGFLPGIYQGTYIDTKNTQIEKLIANIRNKRVGGVQQKDQLDLLRQLNEKHRAARPNDPQLEARIQSFELAFRMQREATEAFDVSREPKHILEAYGPGTQARQILIARRLIERGVRFVQSCDMDTYRTIDSGTPMLSASPERRVLPMAGWWPVVVLPLATLLLVPDDWPRWGLMWLLSLAIYVGCKWLTWRRAGVEDAPAWQQAAYLLFWPGLDARAFLRTTPASAIKGPGAGEWVFAAAKLVLGIVFVVTAIRCVPILDPYLTGWIGMLGIIFLLHFGIFHLLSCWWRAFGIAAPPLMAWPLLSSGLSEFWGRRWNRAFRDLTHRFLFRPLTSRIGARLALFVGFVFSGLVHELVITIPAGGGYGGPTLFFLIQGLGLLVERSAPGRRAGLGSGIRGWLFVACVTVGPVVLLFPPAFVERIIVPFLEILGSL
eukprot:g8449.t1